MVREWVDESLKEKPVSLVRPTMKWKYHPALVFRAALRYRRSGYTYKPTLEEIADEDEDWSRDIERMADLIQYFEDTAPQNSPPWMQEK